MVYESTYVRQGCGVVPATSLLAAAWKALQEIPAATSGCVAANLGTQLKFTREGLTSVQIKEFFREAQAAARKVEPIVEAGNKYGVSADFTRLNGEILLHQIKSSSAYQALPVQAKAHADEVFSLMCFDPDLRNRNPLHPNPLDSAVLGNLINFPKQMFGFPFGGYSTNGNEALSLCLYSYRQLCSSPTPVVIYVLAKGEGMPPPALPSCCERLNLELKVLEAAELHHHHSVTKIAPPQIAVVMTSFSNSSLGDVASWVSQAGMSLHIHILDVELRAIIASSAEPVHFELPIEVRSMSLQEGMFNSGYQLHRDTHLRDLYVDLPYSWQTQYASPNEGGSGNSTPLFIDFCFILMGWSALREVAKQGQTEEVSDILQPRSLGPYSGDCLLLAPKIDEALEWAKASMNLPREHLERHVLEFQRNFVGGKFRDVEAVVTAGGTRSINLSLESVFLGARKSQGKAFRCKVITGNPHLAVERAERRFQFDCVRVEEDGRLCVQGLKHEIADPSVVAVYTQTLSYTDGITDPLSEVLTVLEAENQKRQAAGGILVTLINDSCLALSVLIHNDGVDGRENMRVLDLSKDCITPTIVMLDAHKHLGADKGISMVMGTPGTLQHLAGHVRVGTAPSRGELVRAIADLSVMGVDRYHDKYAALAAAVGKLASTMEDAGMKIVHAQHRAKGSSVVAVEDPHVVVQKKLKKMGYGTAPLYKLHPDQPARCQTGWMLSLTPHALREYNGRPALDAFAADVVRVHRETKPSRIARFFRDDSLLSILFAGGNEELWLFGLLRKPGMGRSAVTLLIRRVYSMILDGGEVCSQRERAPVQVVASRTAVSVAVVFLFQILRHSILRRRGALRAAS